MYVSVYPIRLLPTTRNRYFTSSVDLHAKHEDLRRISGYGFFALVQYYNFCTLLYFFV